MDFEGIAAPQVEEQRERLKEFVLEHAKQLREIEVGTCGIVVDSLTSFVGCFR